ncbi:MAG: transporter substrate-binding protein [Thermomicrobiales bacterium]|nr:transporter substrate-binding protein [Thermomicrobiales bacterium]
MGQNGRKIANLSLSRRTALKAAALGVASAACSGSLLRTVRSAAAQGQPGGTLVIGKPYEITGYDPHVEASQTSWEIQAVVYESLIFLDDDLNPAPGLAESWEAPDDRTYVFHLREGVKFHNGREMTADDVFFSLQRVLTYPEAWWDVKMGPPRQPEPAEATAAALGTPVAGPVVGLTIEVTGPYEVTATLSEPYAPFLASLTGTPVSIVPGAEVESGEIDLATQMVGTGPFQLVEHTQDQRWVFSKFADYWQQDLPLLDEVVWQVMTDEAARVAALRAGEIQLTMFENPKMLDLLANDPNVTTVVQAATNYYVLFVNANPPELSDERVRQAISLGIDREQIRDVALFGRAHTTGPIAAAFTQLARPLDEIPFYTRDVARAKQLLADAGYADGMQLQLLITPVLAATIPIAELMKTQLAEVGINIEIVQRDLATFVDEYSVQGTAQLAISWWAGYSDPYLILLTQSSGDFAPILGISDPKVDELIASSASTVEPEARLQVLRELEDAIATVGGFQPLVTRDNFIAYRQDLVGNVTFAQGEGFGLPLWHRLEQMTLIQ